MAVSYVKLQRYKKLKELREILYASTVPDICTTRFTRLWAEKGMPPAEYFENEFDVISRIRPETWKALMEWDAWETMRLLKIIGPIYPQLTLRIYQRIAHQCGVTPHAMNLWIINDPSIDGAVRKCAKKHFNTRHLYARRQQT